MSTPPCCIQVEQADIAARDDDNVHDDDKNARCLPDWKYPFIHKHTRKDVYHTAFLLRSKVPPELIPKILEYAEYWVCSETASYEDQVVMDHIFVCRAVGAISYPGMVYLSSLPAGDVHNDAEVGLGRSLCGPNPVRKIHITVQSRGLLLSPLSTTRLSAQDYIRYLSGGPGPMVPTANASANDTFVPAGPEGNEIDALHADEEAEDAEAGCWFEAAIRTREEAASMESLDDIIVEYSELRNLSIRGLSTPDATGKKLFGSMITDVFRKEPFKLKTAVWSVTDPDPGIREWVATVKKGDIVDLRLCVKKGWRNKIRYARIEVYTAAVR